MRIIAERPDTEDPDLLVHPEWRERHPWLVQAMSHGRQPRSDHGLFTDSPTGGGLARWRQLGERLGGVAIVAARQVHGAAVRVHGPGAPELRLAADCDGHVTRAPGQVVAVVTADCVPLTLVAPRVRAVAVLHAGWRGASAGIAEAGLATLRDRFGVRAAEVEAHLGPAICGGCYEVGPEVHAALAEPGTCVPEGPQPIDVPARLGARLMRAGVPHDAVTRSEYCTRCGDTVDLYSHRRGDAGRQVTLAGVRGA